MMKRGTILIFLFLNKYFSSIFENQEYSSDEQEVKHSKTIIEELKEMSISEFKQGKKNEILNEREFSLYCFKVESNDFYVFTKDLIYSIETQFFDNTKSGTESKIKISKMLQKYTFLGEFPNFLSQALKEDFGVNPKTGISARQANYERHENSKLDSFLATSKCLIEDNNKNNNFAIISDGHFLDFDFFKIGNVIRDYIISEKFNKKNEKIDEKIEKEVSDYEDRKIILDKILHSDGITLKDPDLYDVLTLEFKAYRQIIDNFKDPIYKNEAIKVSFIEEMGLKYNCFTILINLKEESWKFLQKFISKPTESYIVISLSQFKKERLNHYFVNSTHFESLSDMIFLACDVETRNISESLHCYCEFMDKKSLFLEYTNSRNNIEDNKAIGLFSKGLSNIKARIRGKYINGRFKNLKYQKIHSKADSTDENLKFEVFHRTENFFKTNPKSIVILATNNVNMPKYLIYFNISIQPFQYYRMKNIGNSLNLIYKFSQKIREQTNSPLLTGLYSESSHYPVCVNHVEAIRFKKIIRCSYESIQFYLSDFYNLFEKKVRKDCAKIKEFLMYKNMNRFELLDLDDKMSNHLPQKGKFGTLKLISFDESNNIFFIEDKYIQVHVMIIFFKYEDTDKNIDTFCYMKHFIYQKFGFKELFFYIKNIFNNVLRQNYSITDSVIKLQNPENEFNATDSKNKSLPNDCKEFDTWFNTVKSVITQEVYDIEYLESVFVSNFIELIISELKTIYKDGSVDANDLAKQNKKIDKIESCKKDIISECITLLSEKLKRQDGDITSEVHVDPMNNSGINMSTISEDISKITKEVHDECFKNVTD